MGGVCKLEGMDMNPPNKTAESGSTHLQSQHWKAETVTPGSERDPASKNDVQSHRGGNSGLHTCIQGGYIHSQAHRH